MNEEKDYKNSAEDPGQGVSMKNRRHMVGPRGMMPGQKARDFKGSIARIIRYMSPYRFRVVIMLICAVAGTVFTIVGPRILGQATTELFNGAMARYSGTGSINFVRLGRILLSVLGLYAFSACFSLVQGFLMTGISNDVTYRLRKDISVKINRLPLRYFESRTTGEILSRITNDVDTLQTGVSQSVTQLLTSAATLIGVLCMMLSISIPMTLASLVMLPVSMITVRVIMKHSQPFFIGQQKYLGEVNGQIEEIYGGHTIVKAFNKEEDAEAEFEKVNRNLYSTAWKSQFFGGMMMPLMNFIGNLGYVMIAVMGSFMVIRGAIQVGDIQSFFQYIRSFTQPISQIAQVLNMLQSAAAAAERVFEFLDEPEEEQSVEDPADPSSITGSVTFDHVRFGYDPDKIIIHDFSAEVQKGQKIAIVGPTGAGKTTMIKLLMRYYDVDGGHIRVDGTDIRSFNRSRLRESFGMVLQDTWLFSGTIMENIRYGRPEATDEEVIAAARAAHVHNFIMQQPGGYQMILNEETSNISQGQKQLLTIARAILADNRILILDEATSSVDTRTEIRIQKAMDNLMKGRTSFIIAHRLSTIRDADLILFMKDGDIVEQGTHEELLALGGHYAAMYNSQFEKIV